MSTTPDDNVHHDALINFMFDRLPVRGVLAQLSSEWRELHGLHAYVPTVQALLGEAIVANAMIASTMKFDGMVTLQLHGQGSLGMLVTQCNQELQVRGMAGELVDGESADDYAAMIGEGRLTMTVDAKDAKDRYQGIVGVEATSLAGTLRDYYRDSAQLAAHFVLLSDGATAAGLMLQRMPDGGEMAADDWHRLCLMADTLTLDELRVGASNGLLHKLYAEDDVVAYAARALSFHCRCSQARAERAVRMLGEQDALKLLAEQGDQIEIICEFCNRKRTLDAIDVRRLFDPAGVPSDGGLQ
ncbi:MAG: Hsp33 family molecular chaperone HslO [Pseudomonadota bacterium]